MKRSCRIVTILRMSLIDPSFIASHRKLSTAFTRNRKLTFGTVVATILHLVKKSLQIECNLLGEHLMTEPASKQAFSKARYKISHTGFMALNDQLLEECYRGDSEGLWYGFRVFGTDGSTIRLPKSEEAEEYFGRWDRGEGRNDRCPIVARVSEVVELTSGIIVSARLSPWSFGERVLASEQIQEVSKCFHNLGQHKQLFVFDRGYVSKEMIQLILKAGADFIFRMPRGYNKVVDEKIAGKDSDSLIEISPGLPQLRLVTRKLPSGEICALLTSVVDQDGVPGDALYRLYWLRWSGCEEGYKRQKVTLELENFAGTGVEAILQEFWATVVSVNLFQVHCLDEEGAWNPEEPPEKRINRSVAFGSLRKSIFEVLMGEITAEEFQNRFCKVARRFKVKVRPDRSYSRDGVGKPKRYHVFRRTC